MNEYISFNKYEYYFLRLLSLHRSFFSKQIQNSLRVESEIEWLDHKFDSRSPTFDAKYNGINFLQHDETNVFREYSQLLGSLQRPAWDLVGKSNETIILVNNILDPTHTKNRMIYKTTYSYRDLFEDFCDSTGIIIKVWMFAHYSEYLLKLFTLWFLINKGYDVRMLNLIIKDDDDVRMMDIEHNMKVRERFLKIKTDNFLHNSIYDVVIHSSISILNFNKKFCII